MRFFIIMLLGLFTSLSHAQVINTYAGNGQINNLGDGGAATLASTNYPVGVVFDTFGNLYISTGVSGNKIRKVSPSGIITTIAGTGTSGYSGDGGMALNAKLNWPSGIAVDSLGNVFIADAANHAIRKVNVTTGIISTIAGNGSIGFSGDGGAAFGASLNYPVDVCFDKFGNTYIADNVNNRVRMINQAGVINTFAGNGNIGHSGDGGLAINAELTMPSGVCSDDTGNIYIADALVVRKVGVNGIISTVAGNGIGGSDGEGGLALNAKTNAFRVTFDKKSEILYICENDNNQIRKVDKFGIITTVAGNGIEDFGGDGGWAVNAKLDDPYGICVDTCGNLYIADGHNLRVRKVTYLGCNEVNINTSPVSFPLNIYPNPFNEEFTITSANFYEVEVVNTLGQVLLNQKCGVDKTLVNMEAFSGGVYFITLTDKLGQRLTKKIVKQ